MTLLEAITELKKQGIVSLESQRQVALMFFMCGATEAPCDEFINFCLGYFLTEGTVLPQTAGKIQCALSKEPQSIGLLATKLHVNCNEVALVLGWLCAQKVCDFKEEEGKAVRYFLL